MTLLAWIILFLIAFMVLAYFRASLPVISLTYVIGLILFNYFAASWVITKVIWSVIVLAPLILLNIKLLRQQLFTQKIFAFFKSAMPSLSETESEALNSGTVGFEGEIFTGKPNWEKLLSYKAPKLSAEEQAFLDGPVEQLCQMVDDWEITYKTKDLPQAVWDYLKNQGFFAMIIPKKYGGKEFSALAHAQVITKLASRSVTLSSTVSVPNSLGPAELLLHYGTEDQKNYYLPRLAKGVDVPCFALTAPEAGSDAASMPDTGIVCHGSYQGKSMLGIKLNFDKRYITLAPIATVIGLAFKLYDPEHLLSDRTERGITCALIPRETAGISIGRRHYPLDIPFQNGPIHGKDVFIPLDFIIGGEKNIGRGWTMLLECLAAGRAISLPSTSVSAAKVAAIVSGGYAKIRQQFNTDIGSFEGIKQVLARITSNAYLSEAVRLFTVNAIDLGEKPSVATAISKYHVTEMGRQVAIDAMDIHGGKGICLGPKNYLGRGYQGAPISITVEGANILTRCMIIFGQGVTRCHPYLLNEIKVMQVENKNVALSQFDNLIFSHVGFVISNFVRSFILAITNGRLSLTTGDADVSRYMQLLQRYSSHFALLSDCCLLIYGGKLKRKESMSARLGDMLSYLYMLSAVIKYYHDEGAKKDDLPLIQYIFESTLFLFEQRMQEVLQNIKQRWIAVILKIVTMPFGRRIKFPSDRLIKKVAKIVLEPNELQQRIATGIYKTNVGNNPVAKIYELLPRIIAAEPLEQKVNVAIKKGKIQGYSVLEKYQDAFAADILTKAEYQDLVKLYHDKMEIINVDDFDPSELTAFLNPQQTVQNNGDFKADVA